MLHGEAVTQVRIPHVLVYVVATYDAQISTRLPSYRLCTCRSSSALIVHLGTTPIYASFGPQGNFMVSSIKHLSALELFFGGAYIRNYTVPHPWIRSTTVFLDYVLGTDSNRVWNTITTLISKLFYIHTHTCTIESTKLIQINTCVRIKLTAHSMSNNKCAKIHSQDIYLIGRD